MVRLKYLVFGIVPPIIAFFFLYWTFLSSDLTFVNSADGMEHDLPFLIHLLRNLVHLSLPTWSWSLSLGGDFLGAGSSLLGDPFLNLGVLLQTGEEYKAFGISIFCRMICTYLFFLIFIRKWTSTLFQASCCATLYALSGYLAVWCIRHTYFGAGMMLLPLAAHHIDLIFKGENRYVATTLTFAFMLFCSFYFAYSFFIGVGLYVLGSFYLHQLPIRKNRNILFGLAFSFILSIGLSAWVLFPSIKAVLDSVRSNNLWHENRWFYSSSLKNILPNIFVPSEMGGLSFLLIANFLLFLQKRTRVLALALLSFFFLCLLLPKLGSAMSLFSAPDEIRWLYLIPFFAVFMFSQSLNLMAKDLKKIAVLPFILGIAVFLNSDLVNVILSVAFSIFVAATLTGSITAKISRPIICILIIATCGNIAHQAVQSNLFRFARLNRVENELRDHDIAKALLSLPSPSKNFYRVDNFHPYTRRNSEPLLYSYRGLASYYSVLSNTIYQAINNKLKVPSGSMSFDFPGLDKRFALMSLLSVKYILTRGENCYLNQAYKLLQKGRYFIYENPYALGLFWASNNYLDPLKEAENISPLDRLQLLLHAVVIDPSGFSSLEKSHLLPLDAIPKTAKILTTKFYTTARENAASSQDFTSGLIVTDEVSGLHASFEKKEDEEIYLAIKLQEQNTKEVEYRIGFAKQVDPFGYVYNREESSQYFMQSKKDLYLANLGSSNSCSTDFRINFDPGKNYLINDISLQAFDLSQAKKYLSNLQNSLQTDLISFDDHLIKAKITTDKDVIVASSLPFSSDWKLLVNNQKTITNEVNYGFIGFYLPRGTHDITLKYVPTVFYLGVVLSILSLFILLFYQLVAFIRKKSLTRQSKIPSS